MSTIANAVFSDSDSENDPDFVLDEQTEAEPLEHKGASEEGLETNDEENRVKEKEAREVLWATFQSSIKEPSGATSLSRTPAPPKLVKVIKRYRFAGEESTQVVDVPEHSEDAKKWPLWESSEGSGDKVGEGGASVEPESQVRPTARDQLVSPVSSSIPGPSSSIPGASRPTVPPGKRPGPRKRKTLLNAPEEKSKKLTTLEKSSMDWKAHVRAETAGGAQLEDELEANRRSGGYLARVEFLERVGARKEEIFDQERSAKRRKG